MKLGKNERDFLYEIESTPGDVLVGFLCSAGSSYIMHKVIQSRVKDKRIRAGLRQQEAKKNKRLIKQLEKKKLITLVKHGINDHKVIVNPAAVQINSETKLVMTCKSQRSLVWDGQWTLVTFDVPVKRSSVRYKISSLLKQIGFETVQLSVYVHPYWIPEIEEYLKSNKQIGQYCHLFRGNYCGDDSKLKEKFGL